MDGNLQMMRGQGHSAYVA